MVLARKPAEGRGLQGTAAGWEDAVAESQGAVLDELGNAHAEDDAGGDPQERAGPPVEWML